MPKPRFKDGRTKRNGCRVGGSKRARRRELLLLSCSQKKRETPGPLPAIDRYDGPAYKTLRRHLRENGWPKETSVAVLSAEHGLFGGLKQIEPYNKRMTREEAAARAPECNAILKGWLDTHEYVHVALGKDYLPAIPIRTQRELKGRVHLLEGQIGEKLHQIKGFLETRQGTPVPKPLPSPGGRYHYFLPDWDDLLDPKFDFEKDEFSGPTRNARKDKHCCVLMKPERMCDGVLVSLAQHVTSKGPLRKIAGTEDSALAPVPMRKQFGLTANQWLFGDCGAFSYVDEDEPALGVEQAVSLYEINGFDLAASVDHIPVTHVKRNGNRVELTKKQRQARVDTTRENANLFYELSKAREASFSPVGTIQGLTAEDYGEAAKEYCKFGYRHLAVGGLVPLTDVEISKRVTAVVDAVKNLDERPWIHVFGVYRPGLQETLRELKVDSFDSATYFRKAWLRSDQNYLATNGKWYAAIRVPMTSDGRTKARLGLRGEELQALEVEEAHVLKLLCAFDEGHATMQAVLDAVLAYDSHLTRSSDTREMRDAYRRTLVDKPWRSCKCPFCSDVGIHVLIFRGANRNKRRGAHNTLMLYGSVAAGKR